MSIGYRQCTHCILDTVDDPSMSFDIAGVCNHCARYVVMEARFVYKGEEGERQLEALIATIREEGRSKPYDCIMGLSGGVDSTYLAYLAKQFGLRPLAVHFDNGWNSELSVSNIENIVSRLGLDLHTLVVNWEEFRDLQLAYLRASVVDIEAVTDHAIIATMYRLAAEHGVRYILSGNNIATESVLPAHWTHAKTDHVNIRDIHKKHGRGRLSTYPLLDFKAKKYMWDLRGIQTVCMLDCVPYIKRDVHRVITDELGWRDYGGKHYESIFTRFYQGYILPTKFGIDKRKAHLSNLICSGQMTREEALEEIRTPPYDPRQLSEDRAFVLKKLGLSEEEFEKIMSVPPQPHEAFEVERCVFEAYPLMRVVRPIVKAMRKLVLRA